jgi:hypothetical protein
LLCVFFSFSLVQSVSFNASHLFFFSTDCPFDRVSILFSSVRAAHFIVAQFFPLLQTVHLIVSQFSFICCRLYTLQCLSCLSLTAGCPSYSHSLSPFCILSTLYCQFHFPYCRLCTLQCLSFLSLAADDPPYSVSVFFHLLQTFHLTVSQFFTLLQTVHVMVSQFSLPYCRLFNLLCLSFL